MNPFDLRGPEFLFFYLILCSVVIATMIYLRRLAESGGTPKTNLSDPYLIAYLRGGKNETLRIAVLSLIDRKLLTVNNQTLQTAENVSGDMVSIPLEQNMLKVFAKGYAATSIYTSPTLDQACKPYETRLQQDGLLPDEATKAKRRKRFAIAASVILGIAAVRIFQSLAAGHFNLLFLILMMLVAALIARAYHAPRLTQRGKEFLEDIQTLHAHVKYAKLNPQQGGASTENMMLAAAIFGVSALAFSSSSTFDYANTLFPRAANQSSATGSSCSSSCGSSCSSSSSSSSSGSSCSSNSGGSSCSSGSSCGGGGCGGGGCGS
jgi:uncharacterized protein (TIGR04222 family)